MSLATFLVENQYYKLHHLKIYLKKTFELPLGPILGHKLFLAYKNDKYDNKLTDCLSADSPTFLGSGTRNRNTRNATQPITSAGYTKDSAQSVSTYSAATIVPRKDNLQYGKANDLSHFLICSYFITLWCQTRYGPPDGKRIGHQELCKLLRSRNIWLLYSVRLRNFPNWAAPKLIGS